MMIKRTVTLIKQELENLIFKIKETDRQTDGHERRNSLLEIYHKTFTDIIPIFYQGEYRLNLISISGYLS